MLKKITTLTTLLITTIHTGAPAQEHISSSAYCVSPEIALYYSAIESTNKFFLIQNQITQSDQTQHLNQQYPQLKFALGKGPLLYSPQNYSDTPTIDDCTVMEQIIGNWLLYRHTRIGDFSLTQAHSITPNIQTQQPLQTLITTMFSSNAQNRLLRLANTSNQDQVLTEQQVRYNIQETILRCMLNLPKDENTTPYTLEINPICYKIVYEIFKKSQK